MRIFPRKTWVLPWVLAFAASHHLAAQGAATWVPTNGQSAYFQPNFLKGDRGALFAVDQSGASERRLRRSDDLGGNWTPVGPPFPSQANVGAMEIQDSRIFLMTWGDGVWRLSSPEDTAWVRVNDGLRNLDSLNHMALGGSALLIAAEYGFLSWSPADSRWIQAGGAIWGNQGLGMRNIAAVETSLFATATDGFLYRGSPAGTGWTWSKLPFRGGKSIVRKGRFLFAVGSTPSDSDAFVFRTGDDGITWQAKAADLPASEPLSGGPVLMARVGNALFVSFHDADAFFLSTDDGETWAPFAGGPGNRPLYIEVLEAVGSELLAMSDEGLYRLSTGFSSVRRTTGRESRRFRLRNGSRTLQYRFEAPGWARLNLYTAAGRLEFPVFQGLQPGGTSAFSLASRIRPGTYLLRMEAQHAERSHVLRIE